MLGIQKRVPRKSRNLSPGQGRAVQPGIISMERWRVKEATDEKEAKASLVQWRGQGTPRGPGLLVSAATPVSEPSPQPLAPATDTPVHPQPRVPREGRGSTSGQVRDAPVYLHSREADHTVPVSQVQGQTQRS